MPGADGLKLIDILQRIVLFLVESKEIALRVM